MKRFIGVLFIALCGNCYADADLSKKSDQTTTMIEAVNLEEQTILMNGTTYGLSTDVVVLNKKGELVGLKGLKKGQFIDFHVDKNALTFRSDLPDLIPVEEIRILSDNEKDDKAY